MSSGAAASTDVGAGNAAREVVGTWGGNAVDALVAGWFALAGGAAEGLFAPVVALVAGPGAGARVFDGRALQPGKGLPRPRGFNHGEAIPLAATAAIPRALFAMAVLHSHRGKVSFARLADAGITLAKDSGSATREETIRRAAAEGPTVMGRERIQNALLAAAGPLARGTVTREDFEDLRGDERKATSDVIEDATLVLPGPLGDAAAEAVALGQAGRLEAITVIDAQGVAGCLVAWLAPGVPVPELGVALPACATPVRRGVPRARPGEILAMPAPLAIVERAEVRVALAGIRAGTLPLEDLIAVATDPILDTGLGRLSARGGSIAVVSDPRGARVVIGAAM